MAENMIIPVTGGCPKCGEPNIPVPVDYNDDTIITCPKCGYEAPWAKFFSLRSTDQ
jgi:predicted nucleic-acid-binding Zn-ribbon protein